MQRAAIRPACTSIDLPTTYSRRSLVLTGYWFRQCTMRKLYLSGKESACGLPREPYFLRDCWHDSVYEYSFHAEKKVQALVDETVDPNKQKPSICTCNRSRVSPLQIPVRPLHYSSSRSRVPFRNINLQKSWNNVVYSKAWKKTILTWLTRFSVRFVVLESLYLNSFSQCVLPSVSQFFDFHRTSYTQIWSTIFIRVCSKKFHVNSFNLSVLPSVVRYDSYYFQRRITLLSFIIY